MDIEFGNILFLPIDQPPEEWKLHRHEPLIEYSAGTYWLENTKKPYINRL